MRARDLNAVSEHEAALELARGDAAMQEDPTFGILGLAAADHELVVLERDREVVLGEPGQRQGDAVGGVAALLDVVGRIAVVARLRGAFHQPVELLEPEEVADARRRSPWSCRSSPCLKRLSRRVPYRRPRPSGSGGRTAKNKGPEGAGTMRRRGARAISGKGSRGALADGHSAPRCGARKCCASSSSSCSASTGTSTTPSPRSTPRGRADPLTLRRLKKRKLMLKDEIQRISDEITPDIIA